ncbi:protein argonaute 6 isoform X7 [Glycine soja]|uniref:protein argonaute 6 isoform X6 n=1 Tax=Glycine max TaxID=3847 RepID=UPI0003DEAF8D|nr:protein argonaute 6 isoform X6 [Glycine max]XP_028190703.1 protein argonaute 6 isoform X7 [Glycine soja]|eukprot:XP_006594374.1 protein argonaute 6 isoform X7 [Glycine max]
MEVAITRVSFVAKGGMTEEVPGIVEAAEPPTSSQSPADVPHNLETEQMTPTKYSIISRNGVGTTGKHIPLLVNLFEVAVNVPDTVFFQYSVAITFEDKQAVESKGIGRKVIDRLYQTYSSELGGKRFVYDGGKTLYTVGPLPLNKYEFKVLLEKSFTKRSSAKSPGANGSLHEETKRSKHSFQSKTFMVEISFATKIPLQSIVISLKEVESDTNSQDALRVLDTILRQRAANCGCLLVRQSFFHDDSRNFNDVGAGVTAVSGFHSSFRSTQRGLSLNIDVSTTIIIKPGPVIDFLLSNQQVKEPRYIDWEKAVGKCYDDDPVLAACGISIEKQLNLIEGRVLETPKLKVGKNDDCIPHNGRWNFNKKTLLQASHIDYWAVVNFSASCDTSYISRELIRCGMSKGINIERPYTLIEEEPQLRKSHPVARVERMFDLLASKLNREPKLILCVLPERKICDIYGPWKKKCLSEIGVVTQCIAPVKITNQYLTNVLLKINSKLGGINSLLAIEHSGHLPLIKDTPTMILGMDVSHNSLGRLDSPSIAAVVGSRHWPLISRYRASVRMQASKVEMIDALYKPLENGSDDGIIRELLLDFYDSSNGRKPTQFIVFRDGVSESQFEQVLTIELNQIIKAYQHLGEVNVPQFTVIVAQKKHHIKLFLPNGPENVPPGTVVDTTITHPRNYDFYMCAHAGMLGTSRPVHYHVLLDEIGFSADGLQNLIHSLSYVNQRSTIATSVVAPICYAHHAAAQMGQLLNFDDSSETGSSPASEGGIPIPELPRLHRNVRSSMFFC